MVGRRHPMRMVLAVLAVLAALAGGFLLGDHHVSAAQGPGGGQGRPGGPGPGGPMGRGGRGGPGGPDGGVLGPLMLNRLDLSEQQRERVKQIVDAQREGQRALDQRAMSAREALETTLVTSPLDEAAIRGRAAELANVEADVAVARGQVYSQVFQVLTADQQSALTKLQAERKQRMEEMRQGRQQRGQQR